jgi:phage-related protein (TIGR01555 family)
MGNILTFARDSLTNLVSRMGTDRDKASHGAYSFVPLTDEQLLVSYKTAWLPRKIVDIPAFDSVRAWRDWQATPKQIEKIEAEEKRLNVKGKVLEAKIKARLWGGAAIMIGTGDGDLSQPLDLERVRAGGLKYLTVLTRRHLSASEMETDPASEFYGKPKLYSLSNANAVQVTIHPSRLVVFQGNVEPDSDYATQMGWGDSVLQSTMDAIKQADSTAANIASLVFEAKIDIIRLPNFMASLADEGYKRKILDRYTLAMQGKGINGTLMLDKEEEYETKSASFSQLPEVLDRFLQIVSGAADIPATRLLSQSPAGMNATGTSDMKNYHDRVAAMQEIEMTPAMYRMDECIIRSALGARDPDVHYRWAPLEQMSEKEKADIFKLKADAARTIAGTGGTSEPLMPIEALSDALVNTFIEDNSLPGLEAAIEEYGKLSEQEEDEDDVQAALAAQQPPVTKPGAANDAAPRTLYVSRELLNGADVIKHFKAQGFDTTLPADDLHVTITFSRAPVDWFKMGSTWEDEVTIPEGGARMMEQFGEATVLLFASNMLTWRHDEMVDKGASWDHPDYQPHVTISYGFKGDLSKVEPYQGKLVFGPELFSEVKEDWASRLTEE